MATIKGNVFTEETDIIRVMRDLMKFGTPARTAWEQVTGKKVDRTLLVQWRIDHGMTQAQMAARCQVSRSIIANLETGVHEGSIGTLMQIELVLLEGDMSKAGSIFPELLFSRIENSEPTTPQSKYKAPGMTGIELDLKARELMKADKSLDYGTALIEAEKESLRKK